MIKEEEKSLKILYDNGVFTKLEYQKLIKEFKLEDCYFTKIDNWQDVKDNLVMYCKTIGLSDSTIYSYSKIVVAFARYLNTPYDDESSLNDFQFNTYTKQDIQNFAIMLKDEMNFSLKTLNKYRFAFYTMSKVLLSLGYNVPFREINDIDELNNTISIKDINYDLFYENEILEIANNSGAKERLIILLAYYCNLKRSDIIALKFSDFQNFSLKLKGKHAQRLPKILYETYYEYKTWFDRESEVFKREIDSDYVFQNRKASVPSYNVVNNAIKKVVKHYSMKKGVCFGLNGKIRARNFGECFTLENIRKSAYVKILHDMTVTEFIREYPNVNKDVASTLKKISRKMY